MANPNTPYKRRAISDLDALDREQALLHRKAKTLEQNWWDFINPTQLAISVGAAALQGGIFRRKKQMTNSNLNTLESSQKKGFWNRIKNTIAVTKANSASMLQGASRKIKQADLKPKVGTLKKVGSMVAKWQLLGLGLVVGVVVARQGIKWFQRRQQKKAVAVATAYSKVR
jgi:hypothetical protein